MKDYIVWYTYGFTNIRLPKVVKAKNEKDAIKAFKDSGTNHNEILSAEEREQGK